VLEIARALPTIEFVMIGSPHDASLLDRLMKEKTPNLQYLGPVSDELKNALVRSSSVGITTSKYEGFGWIPFEFLTAGKPVIAYPLGVFHEIYGDLIIYANDVNAFIRHLTEMQKNAFKVSVNRAEIAQLQKRFSFAPAASRIAKLLGLTSLIIFTRDYPKSSDMIMGCDIVNWKLWKSIHDMGIDIQIYANGTRYSTGSGLAFRTITVGRHLSFLRKARTALNSSSWSAADTVRSETELKGIDGLVAKALDLVLLILEPLSYAFCYMGGKDRICSHYIAASGPPTILAGLIVKFLSGSRVVCIIHDTDFYDMTFCLNSSLPKLSFLMKIYYRIYTYCLRYVDGIITVSRASMMGLSRICPDSNKLVLLWGNAE